MEKISKYLALTFFLPFWYLELLIPRKNTIWIFGAWNGERFSDNSKYLFEYVTTNQPEIRAIWLTKNLEVLKKIRACGGECHLTNSLKGICISLIAKHVFVSSGKKDVNYLFINGAKLVHLWHGNPLKKIGLDDNLSSVNGVFYSKIIRYIFPMSYEFNYDFMVSNSEVFTPLMQSSYSMKRNQILETGCPRNDVFYSQIKDDFNIQLSKRFPDSKIVYYLPTFRNSLTPKNIFTQNDFEQEKVEVFLEKEKIVLVNKGHFVESKKGITNSEKSSRIIHLKDSDISSDINNMLKDADGLITDYSSAFFDFLLAERPIIFAAFDLEEYMSKSRELYFDYEDAIAGPMAQDWTEILFHLKNIWNNSAYKDLVGKKNLLYNKFHDANNSQRVMDTIVESYSNR